MTSRTVRFITVGATGALASLVLFSTPALAQESHGVNSLGHICGQDIGPAPTCTYTPASDNSYGGTGPFTITATIPGVDPVTGEPIEVVVFSEDCADSEFCSDEVGGTIPAGSTVTITVTGPTGGVLAGSAS